jgi:hypothetical protein
MVAPVVLQSVIFSFSASGQSLFAAAEFHDGRAPAPIRSVGVQTDPVQTTQRDPGPH